MRRIGVCVFLPIIFNAAQADVYRCRQADGSVIYSDAPCAPDARKIEVKTVAPSIEEQKRAEERLKDWGHDLALSDLKTRRAGLAREIADSEARIDALNAHMEQELALLRAKKLRANNNLAGATWEESISKEMEAVTRKYQTQIDRIQRHIDRTRDAMDRLSDRIEKMESATP